MTGHSSLGAALANRSHPRWSLDSHPGIDVRVQDVDHQVGDHHRERAQQVTASTEGMSSLLTAWMAN